MSVLLSNRGLLLPREIIQEDSSILLNNFSFYFRLLLRNRRFDILKLRLHRIVLLALIILNLLLLDHLFKLVQFLCLLLKLAFFPQIDLFFHFNHFSFEGFKLRLVVFSCLLRLGELRLQALNLKLFLAKLLSQSSERGLFNFSFERVVSLVGGFQFVLVILNFLLVSLFI
jgi:hypothetical protein